LLPRLASLLFILVIGRVAVADAIIGCQPDGPQYIPFMNACMSFCHLGDASFCQNLYIGESMQHGCKDGWTGCTPSDDPPKQAPAGVISPASKSPAPSPRSASAPPAASPKSKSTPSGDPAKDASSCKQAAKDAISACPTSVDSSDDSDAPSISSKSLRQTCQSMKDSAKKDAQNRNQQGQSCYSAYTSCVDTCNGAGDSSTAKMCSNLSSRIENYGKDSVSSLNASSTGKNCDDNTSSGGGGGGMPDMPQNNQDPNQQAQNALQQQQANDPYGCMSNPNSAACQNCQLNPNTPTCQAMANAQQPPQGKAGFQTASANATDASKFNVGDTNSNPTNAAPFSLADQQNAEAQQMAAQGAVVPNNSGGQIPGQTGGSGSQQATLGNPSHGSPGSPGYHTDISNGFQGGTGFSYGSGGGPTGAGAASPWVNGSPIKRGLASIGGKVMDLKKYLPGQPKYNPANRIEGGGKRINPEISPSTADLWMKHTTRILVNCKLGLLRDCNLN